MSSSNSSNDDRALALHKKWNGKLEIISKAPLSNAADLAVAYTPGVAAVSRAIAGDPRLARDYTMKGNTIAVVTDGSAVLGLGNIGPAAALPVMEGKAALFKSFAGVNAVPICLDTQDTQEIIETVVRLSPAFGGINLEDIAAPRCFAIEKELQKRLDIPVFHDDQHGTAIVVLAGLINALSLTGRKTSETRIVVNGAGSAGCAITELLLVYGFSRIIVCDRDGILEKDNPSFNPTQQSLAARTNPDGIRGSLQDAVKGCDVLIGVSAPGVFTPDMIRSMNEQPIVFAMANPTPEIMPEEAKQAGVYVMGTGRSDFPNQVNNVLAFPGIFKGALINHVRQITPDMHIAAAKAIAGLVSDEDLSPECILPKSFDPRVADAVAAVIREVL